MQPADRDARKSRYWHSRAMKNLGAALSRKHSKAKVAKLLRVSVSTAYRWCAAASPENGEGSHGTKLPAAAKATETAPNSPSSRMVTPEVRFRLEKLRRVIQEHYYERHTSDSFARIARMSKFNLINRFTALYGTSPYRYLLSQRVLQAKRILLTTANSVSAVALAVGFQSPSSLGKAFRSIEGVSLSEFIQDCYTSRTGSE